MPLAHLSIGTADSRIDLLNDHGYYAQDWRPKAGDTEDTFAASALADYRQLTSYRELTTIESIPLTLRQATQDQTVRATQDLRRMLRMARDYWTTRHQPDPVYLQAQASCETNARYAIVHAGDVPEDSNPYGEPFLQAGNRSLMLQVLVLERGPWLETAPGTATCALTAAYQPNFMYPWYLGLYLSGMYINCGSDATLDDLHAAAMTAEGWFKIYTTNTAANDRIITKAGDVLDVGWVFYFSGATEVTFRVNYDAGDSSAVYTWTPDGEWHHWACTYNNGGDAKARIWLDGTLVATAAAATAGAVDSDAANDLIIGNRASYDSAPSLYAGWVRVSSSERYTIAFTSPVMCKLPDPDASTELLIVHEGQGVTTYDLSGNGNDGATNGVWNIDPSCIEDRGYTTPTCSADTLFIANKQNNAQLTHIYYYDAAPGTWSGNLLGNTLPYDLLPAAPAVDDIVYFGIAEAPGTGPFSSLVIDLVAATNITTAVWEYWTGAAWATLTTQDNTNILKNSGVRSVHWSQPTDWAAVTLVTGVGAGAPAISAWWVRLRVTAVGAATAPEAQNTQPYTVNWPWLEIEAGQVPGDFDAWLKAVLRDKSDDDGYTGPPELYWNQAIIGLRSGDRLELVYPATNPQNGNFWPYINATDNTRQNPVAITCAAAGSGAFTARSDSPTGEIVRCTNPGAAWATVWRIQIAGAGHAIWSGIYHSFLRAEMTSGATGDIKVRFVTSLYPTGGAASTLYTSKSVNVPARVTAGVYTTIDLGRMELPPSDVVLDAEYAYSTIEIQLYGNGAADLDICDLVIMPIDEWAVRLTGSSTTARVSAIEYNEYLNVDSITNPKVPIRATHGTISGPQYVQGIWSAAANGPAILHPNVKQRLYFFFPETEQSGGVLESRFEVCATAQLYRQARYLSMRGDR